MQVAFAITGTRWGGPRFLRLTTPRRVAGRRAADLRRAEGHLQTIIGMIEGSGIRAREVRGAVELPKSSGFKPGDHVKILGGPFRGHLALCAGMKSHQRVEVLLALLGSQQRVILPRADVEALATS